MNRLPRLAPVLLLFATLACVTVNVYFPEAAIKETGVEPFGVIYNDEYRQYLGGESGQTPTHQLDGLESASVLVAKTSPCSDA